MFKDFESFSNVAIAVITAVCFALALSSRLKIPTKKDTENPIATSVNISGNNYRNVNSVISENGGMPPAPSSKVRSSLCVEIVIGVLIFLIGSILLPIVSIFFQ